MADEPRYAVVIAWSPRDQAYVARAPDLPGCMAHGSSYEEALANIREAMALWLETAQEDGVAAPEPRALAPST